MPSSAFEMSKTWTMFACCRNSDRRASSRNIATNCGFVVRCGSTRLIATDFLKPCTRWGWRSSDTRELSFAGCRVPEGNLLGPRGQGFHQFLEILDGGRISVAALGLGCAQGAFELAAAYARTREQFGKPIASFQAIRFKLADMATEIEAARNLVYKAAWLKDEGRPFAQTAAMAKLYTGELSRRVCNEVVQIHGGDGFMDEYAVSRFYRDQKVLEIGEGTNEVQRLVIARGLGL